MHHFRLPCAAIPSLCDHEIACRTWTVQHVAGKVDFTKSLLARCNIVCSSSTRCIVFDVMWYYRSPLTRSPDCNVDWLMCVTVFGFANARNITERCSTSSHTSTGKRSQVNCVELPGNWMTVAVGAPGGVTVGAANVTDRATRVAPSVLRGIPS